MLLMKSTWDVKPLRYYYLLACSVQLAVFYIVVHCAFVHVMFTRLYILEYKFNNTQDVNDVF